MAVKPMVEGNQTPNNAEQSNSSQNHSRPYGDMYWVYIIGAWALIGLLLVATFLPNMTERVKFFVTTLWVLVTAFAVIAQAVIYRKQWAIMERQIKLLARSESAYLSVGDLVIPPVRNNTLVVNGKIFNRGKTPAFEFQRRIQIAIGTGTPTVAWGRFEWDFDPAECGNILIVANDSVNFSTDPLRIDPARLTEINEGRQTIVIDGQCRYRDNVGDLLIYVFGLTVEINPPRGHIRYQEHHRENED
jgi:hypothetical protein